MALTRRSLLSVALFSLAGRAAAKPAQAFDVETEDGLPIANFRISQDRSPAALPGVVLTGPARAGLVLYEFFDYACPYCRAASQEIDILLTPDAGFRLGLVHHPSLSPRSAEAARVVLAASRRHGDAAAYKLHAALMEAPGKAGGEKALALAAKAGFDADALSREADSAEVAAVLRAQSDLAGELALPLPSFVLGDIAISGWPGANTTQTLIDAMLRCGGLRCPAL